MKKCILIVDVQYGFVSEATKHIPAMVEELQHHYEHIYITRFYNKPNSFYRTLIKWDRLGKNSKDFELAFSPSENAIIIDKAIYTCINDAFLEQLKNSDIKSVDVCGIDTDICVTKCAVDLFEAGVVPFVLANYCASNAGKQAHNTALGTLKRYIGESQVVQ